MMVGDGSGMQVVLGGCWGIRGSGHRGARPRRGLAKPAQDARERGWSGVEPDRRAGGTARSDAERHGGQRRQTTGCRSRGARRRAEVVCLDPIDRAVGLRNLRNAVSWTPGSPVCRLYCGVCQYPMGNRALLWESRGMREGWLRGMHPESMLRGCAAAKGDLHGRDGKAGWVARLHGGSPKRLLRAAGHGKGVLIGHGTGHAEASAPRRWQAGWKNALSWRRILRAPAKAWWMHGMLVWARGVPEATRCLEPGAGRPCIGAGRYSSVPSVPSETAECAYMGGGSWAVDAWNVGAGWSFSGVPWARRALRSLSWGAVCMRRALMAQGDSL